MLKMILMGLVLIGGAVAVAAPAQAWGCSADVYGGGFQVGCVLPRLRSEVIDDPLEPCPVQPCP